MANMEATELLIQAVEGFQDEENSWNDDLEKFIEHIAETGDTLVPWERVRKIFMRKLQLVLEEFYRVCPYSPGKINPNATNDDFDEMKKRLLQLTEDFDEPPFTIQRLCELLIEPMKNYRKCEKFMRGLEKNLMVVTSWSHTTRRSSQGNDSMVNGISLALSNCIHPSERVKPHWANLPPSPIATGPPKIPGAPDFTVTATPKDSTPAENSSESSNEANDKESNTTEPDVGNGETSDDRKPNVSATIISSSPTITINIKRKIDESSEDDNSKTATQLVAESPTKKLKFDEIEEPQQPDSTESTSTEETHDESAKTDIITPESNDSSENTPADRPKDDSIPAEQIAEEQSAPVDGQAEGSGADAE